MRGGKLKSLFTQTSETFGYLDLYVSTEGNDSWSGRLAEPNEDRTDGPFATIAKARDAVREMKHAAKLAGPVTVWLRDRHNFISEPLVFRPEDSGPVTYAASPGETPLMNGGKRIYKGTKRGISGEFTAAERKRYVVASKYSLTMNPKDPNGGGNHQKIWFNPLMQV